MKLITKYKTTKLIEIAHNSNKLIVCFSKEEACRVFEESKRMKKNILFPITFDDFLQQRFSRKNIETLLIDNIDICLNNIGFTPIEVITLRKQKGKLDETRF